jgi:flagellar basal-body rod modification protein FlgD
MSSITDIAGAGALATSAGNGSNSLGRQEFLRLLVTQLRNQDPLNPLDDREFIAQMAQLSTLDSTVALAGQVQQMLAVQQQTQALQLVGRNVEFFDSMGNLGRGTVSSVRLNGAAPVLVIDGVDVPAGAVQTVL